MADDLRKENQGVQVIARAAQILRVLASETDGLSLGQIANKVELPRSTVQRIVFALTREGLVASDGGRGGLRLGSEIQTLAQAAASTPRDRLRPLMQRIAAETGETVDLAVLQGNSMLFIDQIEGQHRLRTVSSIGESFPLATTANGKAALACLDEEDAAARAGLSGKPLRALLSELRQIRDGALARDEDEHTDGISAMGFGIQDPSGEIFAISIPVPSSRYARIKDTLVATLCRARDVTT